MKQNMASDALDRALTDLHQADIPDACKTSWRDAVKREELHNMKPGGTMQFIRRAALPIAAALVLIVGTAVTGIISPKTQEADDATTAYTTTQASYKTSGAGEPDYDMAADGVLGAAPTLTASARNMEVYEEKAAYDTGAMDEAETSRKIVRTISLTLASSAFDTDYAAILALTETAGGYASSASMYEQQINKRSASLELRIPSANLDSFLNGIAGIGRTTDRYETTTDKTTQYIDTQLRLKTQQDKMTRLQELLLKAETVEDLLDIENTIADTQYMLDSLQSSLLYIDRQVDYATVNITLREQTAGDAAATEELTIGERLVSSLRASLKWLGGFFENMLVFLIAAAPVIIPLLIVYLVVHVIRKHNKSNQ